MESVNFKKYYTIPELTQRYDIAKPALYKRIRAAKVEKIPNKNGGNKTYYSPESVLILDSLHYHLSKPYNTLENFSPYSQVEVVNPAITHTLNGNGSTHSLSNETVTSPTELLNDVVGAVVNAINPKISVESQFNTLEIAETTKKILTSQMIKAILGKSPKLSHGRKYVLIESWKFTRVSQKKHTTYWEVATATKSDIKNY